MCSGSKKRNNQGGFSLLELMVAMAVLGIVLGAAFSLMGSGLRASTATYELTDAQENLRTAQEFITRDLTTAGDGLKGLGTIQVPLAFLNGYLTLSTLVDTNLGILTSDDTVPANTPVPRASPAVNVKTGSDRMTLLTWDGVPPISVGSGKITFASPNTNIQITPADITNYNFTVGEVIAISSQSSLAFGVISSITGASGATPTLVLTDGDIYSLNQTTGGPIATVSTNGTVATSIMRVQIIQYFVNANGLLVRRVFGVKGAGFVDGVIADHIANLKFRYLTNILDANGFVTQPTTSLTSGQETAVRQVEATVTAETVHQVMKPTNTSNGRPQISVTSRTAVRNMQFRQAMK